LQLHRQDGVITLQADAYRLVFHANRPFVDLHAGEQRIAELFPFSAVHPLNGRDDTYEIGEWSAVESPDEITLSIRAKSTAWTSKTFTFRCTPSRFTYGIEVEGTGALAEVDYFGGWYSASLRWGSGYFWSGQRFAQVFNPEPNIPEVFHVPSGSGTKIDLTGVPIPARGDWFFTPAPFCFAGQYADGWLALGVEAKQGANTYTQYGYHGNLEAFHLSLSYEGHTQVNGTYTLPSIGFDFAADEYAAIAAHVATVRAAGFVPIPAPAETPSWWREPIFCGWGPQCYLASLDKGHAPSYARQEHYERFMATVAEQQLDPGVVVLDDKWQAAYGENNVDTDKWPDIRGFVDTQHAAGRKVLLWLKAWDPDGVPVEECIVNAGGMPLAFDPTNPAYEARLRASVRRMLSADGYDADGFKIDFTARIPSGYGLRLHDDSVWGIELMRRYLSILHSESKAVKPDALIMSHTPHPYLADVLDMIRLNDINIGPGKDVNTAMRHRAKIAAIGCPEAVIDTDNWPITDKAAWRAYLQIQPELGVPSLYTVTHIDSTGEPLDADDYQLIRDVWAKWRARVSS
jgi:hypothetical protein